MRVMVAKSAASRQRGADGPGFVATRSLRSEPVLLAAVTLATALSIITIGGCTPTYTADGSRNFAKGVRQIDTISTAAIPLPDPTLLRHQPEPDCAFRGQVSNPITPEEMRQKLDYQQQCYRHAETIVRARLAQLQDSVQEIIKVARRR